MNHSPEWPKWFVKCYQFSPENEAIDKKKWRTKVIIATLWLLLGTVSGMTSTDHTNARMVFSFGYEYLGEYAFKVGNLCIVIQMLQFLACQLIQYRSLRVPNLTSKRVRQPLLSIGSENHFKNEVKLLTICDMFILAWCVGYATFSAYSLHGTWYVLVYKVAIGCIGGYACSTASCLMICNCLFLHRTCQVLIRKVTVLNDRIIKQGTGHSAGENSASS